MPRMSSTGVPRIGPGLRSAVLGESAAGSSLVETDPQVRTDPGEVWPLMSQADWPVQRHPGQPGQRPPRDDDAPWTSSTSRDRNSSVDSTMRCPRPSVQYGNTVGTKVRRSESTRVDIGRIGDASLRLERCMSAVRVGFLNRAVAWAESEPSRRSDRSESGQRPLQVYSRDPHKYLRLAGDVTLRGRGVLPATDDENHCDRAEGGFR